MITYLGLICAVAVLVRARPWGALVLRVPLLELRELLLCGYCLGFWVGLGYEIVHTWSVTAVGTAFIISAGAGTLASLQDLLAAVTDNQRLQASERLK